MQTSRVMKRFLVPENECVTLKVYKVKRYLNDNDLNSKAELEHFSE